jgi:hypothetical protein
MQSLKQFDEVKHSEGDNYFVFGNWQWTKWLLSEGFEHISDKTENSYGFLQYNPDERYNSFLRNNYWYWSKLMGCYIFRIYVFRNCVVVDKDWDCGGNAGGRCFDVKETPINVIWDQIIEYIKSNL